MPTAIDKEVLLARLKPLAQEHLLAFWDRLDEQQRRSLAMQIDEIDAGILRALQARKEEVSADGKAHFASLAARAQSPPAIRLNQSGRDFSREDAVHRGQQALRAGEVGMVLVAGGLGTRL